MAEPSSEWGKQLVERVDHMDGQVERMRTVFTALSSVGGVISVVVIGLSAWALSSVVDLKTSAAVLQNTTSTMSKDVEDIHDQIQTQRQTLDALNVSVNRLEATLIRFEKLSALTPSDNGSVIPAPQ